MNAAALTRSISMSVWQSYSDIWLNLVSTLKTGFVSHDGEYLSTCIPLVCILIARCQVFAMCYVIMWRLCSTVY